MTCLDIICFFVFGFVAVFTVLFIIVCVFDEMMEKSLKLEERDECNSEENKRSAT